MDSISFPNSNINVIERLEFELAYFRAITLQRLPFMALSGPVD